MIKSMTGFGKAEVAIPDKKITVEIRTLNSKQLDLAVKLPSAYRPLEYEIRALAAKALQRGKADLYISVESTARQTRACIDEELFHLYYNQLLKICREQPEIGTPGSAENNALIQSILRLPDVVSSQEESVSEQEHAAVLDAVGQALAHLDEFRTQEGAILIADLLKRIDRIEAYKQEVIPFEKARTEAIRARIRESLAQLQAEVDNNRLEQEMIFYIEKLDITEEKVRLTNHCNYFREVAASEECAGRKLGFIAQEMGREINTMGSKANNSEIQILVVKTMGKLVIFSAPSGSGKTTIVRELLQRFPRLEFSVSATSRAPRGKERNGVDYFFLSPEEFRQAVQEDKFVEWEEVYSGTCYGTLRSEMERIWQKGNVIVFDVDVIGGLNLKRIFGDRACAIFIMPPSIETLRERLVKRGTDSPETIECRVAKAEFELTKAPEFDHVVVNDDLAQAIEEATRILSDFLAR